MGKNVPKKPKSAHYTLTASLFCSHRSQNLQCL